MSMTLTDAKTYIARVLGGSADSTILSQAGSALAQAQEILLHRNNWSFLRLDTSASVALTCTGTSGQLTLTTTGSTSTLRPGMAASGSNIGTGATIASIDSETGITLDVVHTGTVNGTVTFTGDISITAGTDTYILPHAFWKPMGARFVGTWKHSLSYIPHAYWDKVSYDQTIQGRPSSYTIYNENSFTANGLQRTYLKLFPVPSAADTVSLRYYRTMKAGDTYVDVADEYLYLFLDLARLKLLETRNPNDNRIGYLAGDVEMRIRRAIGADRQEGGEDEYETMRGPVDFSGGGFTGDFWPRGDSWGIY